MAENRQSSGSIPGVNTGGNDTEAKSPAHTSQPFSGHGGQGGADRKFFGMRRSTLLMVVMFLVGIGWAANEIRKVRARPAVTSAPEDALTVEGVKMMAQYAQKANKKPSEAEMASLAINKPLRGSVQNFENNPFETLIEPPPPEPVPEAPEEKEPVEVEPKEPVKNPPPVAGLTLDLIMTSSRGNRASISGRLLSEGDRIEGWTIKEIYSNRVVLKWEDVEHILRVK